MTSRVEMSLYALVLSPQCEISVEGLADQFVISCFRRQVAENLAFLRYYAL